MTYDLIGEIRVKDGTTSTLEDGTIIDNTEVHADSSGNPYYHVNTLPPLDEKLEKFVVVPTTLSRIFAGRDDTICLKFSSRDEWLSQGYENVEEA